MSNVVAASPAQPLDRSRRVGVLGALVALYGAAVLLGATAPRGYRNASGVVDLGHLLVPSLDQLLGERRAEYAWWLGTLPLEVFFVAIAGAVLLYGRGARLALCLYAMYALHWLVLLLTTLPAPDHIVWRFPPGVLTLGQPREGDLWFSGHVANAFVVALATRGGRPWVAAVAWAGVAFEVLLVLSARTHYSIDVVGGLLVGYVAHRVSLDLAARARRTRTPRAAPPTPRWVDDVHARLNRTSVRAIVQPSSVEDVQRAVAIARREGCPLSIAGGRHAMGGQQFGTGCLLLDMRGLGRVRHLDAERGIVDVEAGIEWPELVVELARAQRGRDRQWGIVQKQTGADRLTIGGALAANVHGRGLRMRPIVQDVESLTLVDAGGRLVTCSREERGDLFRLVVGGYGLFGAVTSVRLRLAPRRKLRRVVEVRDADSLPAAFAQRIAAGFEYGDFQFAIDPASEDFLRTGVFSCYEPVPETTPITPGQRELEADDWARLLYLAHTDKRRAFELYRDHYLATDGQVYWSDTHQLGVYLDDYHREIDRRLGARVCATEMISELYVPRPRLPDFLAEMRDDFRRNAVELIYGSVRLIERDDETVLAWAREPWACVVLNLHVVHTPEGLVGAAAAFRRLIDMAARRGGTYYLTYHRWATRAQVAACHPRLPEFLRRKRVHDPEERFQSEWYRHYRSMFSS